MEEELLMQLIKINSISGNEKEIANFLEKRLKKNFKIKKQKVNNNYNLFAYVGKPKIII